MHKAPSLSQEFPLKHRARHHRRTPHYPTKASVCDCGAPVKIYFNSSRNPHSKHVLKGIQGVTKKDHDLCHRCFQLALARIDQALREMTTSLIGEA